jgi:hypothetical protein
MGEVKRWTIIPYEGGFVPHGSEEEAQCRDLSAKSTWLYEPGAIVLYEDHAREVAALRTALAGYAADLQAWKARVAELEAEKI